MARHSKLLPKNLKPSHYYAMGKVSARWAQIEQQILKIISDVSGIDVGDVAMMLGHASLNHWLDVLAMYVSDTEKYQPYIAEYNKLISIIQMLYGIRNSIVHPTWTTQEGERVKGYTLPKSGRKLMKNVDWSAKEMSASVKLFEASLLTLRVHTLLLEDEHRVPYVQRLELVHQFLCYQLDPQQHPAPSLKSLDDLATPRKET